MVKMDNAQNNGKGWFCGCYRLRQLWYVNEKDKKGKSQLERLMVTKLIEMYAQRHPPVQADIDPEKKTIVVLGSGWASTSFLKDIDTDDYNVVRTTLNILFFIDLSEVFEKRLLSLLVITSCLHLSYLQQPSVQ